MTPADWNTVLAPTMGWQAAYAVVEREAREFLSRQLASTQPATFTTSELAEALYPEKLARGDGITARKRLFKALAALATHDLADCASRGEPRKLKHTNKTVRPWIWHAPTKPNNEAGARVCPHCGGAL